MEDTLQVSFFCKIHLIFVLCLPVFSGVAQQLDQIGQKNPLKVSGGVSMSQVFYTSQGIENRRDPYNYFLTGNLNFDLYGFSVPLTFTFSNQNVAFQQPFNQFTLSPTYKNVQFYAGYNSLTFSRYTLAGHIFLGGGVEVRDLGKWSVSTMYGRLQKAVEADSAGGETMDPYYQRLGGGVKVRYADGGDFAELIVFKSSDDEQSLKTDPEAYGVLPEENLVLGVQFGKTFLQRINVKGEVAGSALTRDLRADEVDFDGQGRFSLFKPFFNHRTSTSYYHAFNTQINYAGNFYTIGASYERVDPGYETHGAYYFNNDLESIALNGSLNLLQNKVTLAMSVGSQRNDLDKTESSSMSRLSNSVNVGFMPGPKVNFSLSYSNFSTYTNFNTDNFLPNQLSQFDNLDTLNYRQVSQSANLSGNFILGNSKDIRHNLNVNGSYQTSDDSQSGADSKSDFYTANTAYSYGLNPLNLTMTTSFNANISSMSGTSTTIYGPSLVVSKSFMDRKLKSSVSGSYNQTQVEGTRTGTVFNFRIVTNYVLAKKHHLSLNAIMLNRNQSQQTQDQEGGLITREKQFTEYTVTLGYAYSFSK